MTLPKNSTVLPTIHHTEVKKGSQKIFYLLISDLRSDVFTPENFYGILKWAMENYDCIVFIPTGSSLAHTLALQKSLDGKVVEPEEIIDKAMRNERQTVGMVLSVVKMAERQGANITVIRLKAEDEPTNTPPTRADVVQKNLGVLTTRLNGRLKEAGMSPLQIVQDMLLKEMPVVQAKHLHSTCKIEQKLASELKAITNLLDRITTPKVVEKIGLATIIDKALKDKTSDKKIRFIVAPVQYFTGKPSISLPIDSAVMRDDLDAVFIPDNKQTHPDYREAQKDFKSCFDKRRVFRTRFRQMYEIHARQRIEHAEAKKQSTIIEKCYALMCVRNYVAWETAFLIMLRKIGGDLGYPFVEGGKKDCIFELTLMPSAKMLGDEPGAFRFVDVGPLMPPKPKLEMSFVLPSSGLSLLAKPSTPKKEEYKSDSGYKAESFALPVSLTH